MMEQTLFAAAAAAAAAAAYRVSQGATATDVIGRLRYSKIEVAADINASLFALAGTVSGSGMEDWVDPSVGVRIQHPVSNRWTLVANGDVGGFGVGSDFAWQAAVGANYQFSKSVSGKVGYRVIAVDYDKGGFLYDMKGEGICAGVGIRF